MSLENHQVTAIIRWNGQFMSHDWGVDGILNSNQVESGLGVRLESQAWESGKVGVNNRVACTWPAPEQLLNLPGVEG